ncbi:hypothetical protein CC2G_004119 [Coprinopsis cinerea AmutBmut pab1-1]|nr:hypothetical protein CC2G_004119 [Coprinopsis cinerea AmutBmut pab1-1]
MPKIPSASSIKSVRKAPVPSRQEQQQSKESGGTSTQEASGSNSNASAAKAKGKATKESTCKQCKENPWVPPAHPGNFQHSTGVITVTSGQATVLDGINPPQEGRTRHTAAPVDLRRERATSEALCRERRARTNCSTVHLCGRPCSSEDVAFSGHLWPSWTFCVHRETVSRSGARQTSHSHRAAREP